MVAIKRYLSLLLVLIYLSGCSQLSWARNAPNGTLPAPTISQLMTTPQLHTSPTPPAATPVNTPQASQAADAYGLQQPEEPTASVPEITPGACPAVAITQPPKPLKTYQPNELDTETNLHVTGIAQWIDLASYRLKVTGLVEHPLELTYEDLRCMPKVKSNPALVCAGVFTDLASWTGVPIEYILELAGVQQNATQVTLVSADGYRVNIPLETARASDNFLAYEVNGKTLPVVHGFPLRAVFPSMWGSYWIKWLVEIQIS